MRCARLNLPVVPRGAPQRARVSAMGATLLLWATAGVSCGLAPTERGGDDCGLLRVRTLPHRASRDTRSG